jgi:hypothetical protein
MYKRYAAITTIMGGLIALFTPTADAAPSGDCARVAAADRSLCRSVQAQHAYGWTDSQGNPLNWVVNGRLLVREITHQGLTQEEMGDYLRAEARNYRNYVTHVSFNMDAITRACGHRGGSGSVAYVTERGKSYTFRIVVCD